MGIWFYIGIALVIWVLYDMYYGVTWITKPIYKENNPKIYWCVTFLWIVVAISTLLYGLELVS